jgi:hypothetical protein
MMLLIDMNLILIDKDVLFWLFSIVLFDFILIVVLGLIENKNKGVGDTPKKPFE